MLNFKNQIQDLTKNKIKLKPYMGRAIPWVWFGQTLVLVDKLMQEFRPLIEIYYLKEQ